MDQNPALSATAAAGHDWVRCRRHCQRWRRSLWEGVKFDVRALRVGIGAYEPVRKGSRYFIDGLGAGVSEAAARTRSGKIAPGGSLARLFQRYPPSRTGVGGEALFHGRLDRNWLHRYVAARQHGSDGGDGPDGEPLHNGFAELQHILSPEPANSSCTP